LATVKDIVAGKTTVEQVSAECTKTHFSDESGKIEGSLEGNK
jgi:hypothetical protein